MGLMPNSAYDRSCPYIYRGRVEDNLDPLGIGRCRVYIPSIHGELPNTIDILPWARPLVLSPVGDGRGSINIPEVGDIVWILFEGAQREFPVYIGGTYASSDNIDIDIDEVTFYLDKNSKISYHKKDERYIIQVNDNSIILSNNSIILSGNVEITGDLTIKGSCNKECDCT